jgi:endonuclease/exonuclease/phosphatase family metal-dependent hydrolase
MTRRLWLACALAACLTTGLYGQVAPPSQAPSSAPASRPLKVLTFNIHHAEGTDGKVDVARIARIIQDTHADIVGLQEVDRGVERTARRDLLKEIADLTGLEFAFGKNMDHQGGDYGNALLTSRPIVSVGNRLLPNVGGGESRGVLQVVVDVDGRQILVLTTHLDHRAADPQRVASADAIVEMSQGFGSGPVIVIGDFNDVPGSPTWTRLMTVFTDTWAAVGRGDGFTIPVEAPSKRIDWILVRGLEPVSAEVLNSNASDHLPVLGVMTLR